MDKNGGKTENGKNECPKGENTPFWGKNGKTEKRKKRKTENQ